MRTEHSYKTAGYNLLVDYGGGRLIDWGERIMHKEPV